MQKGYVVLQHVMQCKAMQCNLMQCSVMQRKVPIVCGNAVQCTAVYGLLCMPCRGRVPSMYVMLSCMSVCLPVHLPCMHACMLHVCDCVCICMYVHSTDFMYVWMDGCLDAWKDVRMNVSLHECTIASM